MNSGRILVVDDEPRNVKLLVAHLGREGYMPLAGYSGEDALRLAASENPDVILLDVMMPDLDGYEVTRRLKAELTTCNIPVVLVTSLDGSDNRVKGLDAGADEFLTKPVNRAELLVRVRALQRMKQMHDELHNRQQVAWSLMHDIDAKGAGHPMVLVVEDDARLSKQYSAVLGANGYDPVLVASAAAARETISQFAPDLVLLDYMLPDGNGLQLLEEWKAQRALADIPVIMITSSSDLDRKIKGIEQGADDYLIKPVENNELLARVRASLRRATAQQRLKGNVERMKEDMVVDGLTGVHNRYYLDADLTRRLAQALRDSERLFSVVMVDIDHFKAVNDEFGHLIGDTVLREVAQRLQQAARTSDIVTRYGGEEFCVVLPETNQKTAQLAAERLRQGVEGSDYGATNGRPVTASFGVATFRVEDHSITDLLSRADAALYRAKEDGRNRVCMALEPTLPTVQD
ncbi:diguanylate cyclase [Solemya velum gill symbiont]|uniref:diguanylate cyclase n=1 Tax=Solemya velum gill symbiont TaxID=2340 RepID=UPI0015C3CEC9|nr:diguanylate cyclase [Solemya velum gill symbiont]